VNQLKVAKQNAIIGLAAKGWSHRRIARELGIHRKTVKRYVERAVAEANDPEELSSEPAKVTPGSIGRRSWCEPLRPPIEQMVARGRWTRSAAADAVASL
jgi:IS30 family transposase